MVACPPSIPRILVVANSDAPPPPESGLGKVLGRAEYRFILASMEEAPGKIAEHDPAAAILLTPSQYFNGHERGLTRVLDDLAERHIGAIVLTLNEGDFALADKLCGGEGLMALPSDCSPEELLGRMAGLAAARPVIEQLQRENAMLRKFDAGMSTQITQIDEEMRLAARLQVDFLPRTLPEVNTTAFDVFFRPASYVSGDIYDATRLDEDHVGFFVADAVGHGMPAALLTIFLKRTLQTKEVLKDGYRLIPPNEALEHLNNELVGQQLSLCQFVTMAYAIINTRTLELQWARAGHPLPMLLKANGSAEELEVDGALLGVFADEKFPLQKVQLEPGDAVLIYSDGFESAFHDPSGMINERYRLEFAKLAGADAKGRFAAMVQELDRQEGSLHQRDDLTALMMRIGKKA